MNPQDRTAIENIFSRLKDVERQGAPRDPEAEAFIRNQMETQPGAAYYLAQTVAVQENALQNAQKKIAELEQRAPGASTQTTPAGNAPVSGLGSKAGAAASGSGLNSFFGRNPDKRSDVPASGQPAQQGRGGMGGGGFLAGAAQTAMGVAGGMMLGSLLGGLFSGNDAHAGQADAAGTEASTADAAASDPAASEALNADSTQVSEPAEEDVFQDDGGGLFDDGGFEDI